MGNYPERLFISKNTASGVGGLPALEVPRPFSAQGYISACGNAVYSSPRTKYVLAKISRDIPCLRNDMNNV